VDTNQLPDWKKEELLQKEMERAEAFMSRGDSVAAETRAESSIEGNFTAEAEQREAQTEDAVHRPKVSTWGVFPRPENISKAYGGGRNIPVGGLRPRAETEEDKEKAKRTKALLDSYRVSMGIDTAVEDKHRDEVMSAIVASRKLIQDSRPFEAVQLLESVKPYMSTKSKLGGELHIELALALEVVGQREAARELYAELRKSPVTEIARKAKQLSFGFSAMQELKVDSDGASDGLKVMDFRLPDIAKLSTRRPYDTTYFEASERSEAEIRERLKLNRPSKQQRLTNQATFAVFVAIISAIALNLFVLRH